MQLVKVNPMRDMVNLRNRTNRFFDAFYCPSRNVRTAREWTWDPKVDIYEDETAIVLKAELPGVEKENIVVDVKDRILTLKGERSSDEEVKDDRYYRRERTFGSFERRFTLPDKVNPEKISADYKDGVLKVEIPKPEEIKPKQVTVH